MKEKIIIIVVILAIGIVAFVFFYDSSAPQEETIQEETIQEEEEVSTEETTTSIAQKPEVWIKEDGIRVENSISSCTILMSDGTYRMYYSGMGNILSVVSTDGLNWAKEPGARISRGANSAIFKLSDDSYRMIYNEQEGIPPNANLWFVSAISSDGINWTKESGIRLKVEGAPDFGAISVPDIIKLPDGRYRMYYVGDMFNYGPKDKQNSIRCAISSDDGWTWEREIISGIPTQSMDPDVIILPNGNYLMFFTASPPGKWPGNLHVYSAISIDGLIWTKEEGVRLAPGGAYDKELCLDPDVVELPDGSYRMYYSGQNEEFSHITHILSATSP